MIIEELQTILEKHQAWLANRENGERADLCGADLCGADLCGANLSRANLCEANLCEANLCEANLYRADLSRADLSRANLYRADLSRANLCGADLSRANLYRADLSRANLCGADLCGANLCGADLCGAKNTPYVPMACPSDGSFIGWKKAHNMIVKLQIPEDAKRSSATGRKCRCDKAVVLAIENLNGSPVFFREASAPFLQYAHIGVLYDINTGDAVAVRSDFDNCFVYRIGETVSVEDFDANRFNECAPGIHFFIDRQEAVDYQF